MMTFKRLAVVITAVSLLAGFGATSAQAKNWTLSGGGNQGHIGNGLALPIQPSATAMMSGTVFPPLLVPVKGAPVVAGTVVKPLLTAMATVMGPITKSGYQRRLVVPANALERVAAQKTVGVKFSNPTVFAVGTNLNYKWPAVAAEFSTGAAVPTATVGPAFGGTLKYSNTLGQRFGGPAQTAVAVGPEPAGLISTSGVTVYIKINGVTPPCTHPSFGGTNASCVAGILLAKPGPLGAVGGATTITVKTPGLLVVGKNVAIMKMGATPLGTVKAKALAATAVLPLNNATSQPGPWTTGKVIISNPAAGGMGEKFTLSGKDSRTAGGNGTIQLVAGAVSARAASGANANRGWTALVLSAGPATQVPSMSPVGIAATIALIVLGFGYGMRKRIFA
jgi:hypothetical protein